MYCSGIVVIVISVIGQDKRGGTGASEIAKALKMGGHRCIGRWRRTAPTTSLHYGRWANIHCANFNVSGSLCQKENCDELRHPCLRSGPRSKGARSVRHWRDVQAEWPEPHPYDDPAFTTPSLRAWFMEMIERFPALGGPYGLDIRRGQRDRRAAAYCIGYHLIYVAIWSDEQATHERAHELAG
jgi:hypothetical protein